MSSHMQTVIQYYFIVPVYLVSWARPVSVSVLPSTFSMHLLFYSDRHSPSCDWKTGACLSLPRDYFFHLCILFQRKVSIYPRLACFLKGPWIFIPAWYYSRSPQLCPRTLCGLSCCFSSVYSTRSGA